MNNRSLCIANFLLVSVVISLAFSSCDNIDREKTDIEVFFSAEKLTIDGKNLYAENDSSIVFKGARHRTDLTSYSGNFSYITSPKNRFSLGLNIPYIKPYSHVQLSIWRKGINNKSQLVISGITPLKFYRSTNKPVEYNNGWEKLKLDFYFPHTYTEDELKIYIWNNSDDTAYYDDFSISIKSQFDYPIFREEALYIEIDTIEYMSLLNTRKRAFDAGVLLTDKDDWVKGYVFGDNKMMKTKLRLKGDWIGHLYGNKWSFRLKLKGENSWNRIKTFSIQNPIARNGASEWFLHKVFQSQDILATRYGFVPVYLNKKSLGLYAWEEHFTKQLVESQYKREGPIIKFFEDVYWDRTRINKGKKVDVDLPYFEAAVIKPFTSSKIVDDSVLFSQYLIAQNLLLQYKNRSKKASEIFDISALAKYYAICDVFQGIHGLSWHNQRFYYNPVLCKLEPIAYDHYTEDGFFNWINRTFFGKITYNSIGKQNDGHLMARELFNDYSFLDEYIKYLQLYSSKEFLNQVKSNYETEALNYDSLIQVEFPECKLNIPKLYENASNIRDELSSYKMDVDNRKNNNEKWQNISKTEEEYTTGLESYYAKNLVAAYKMKNNGDSILIRVVNYFTDPVLLLGVGKSNKKIIEFLHPEPEMAAYKYKVRNVYEFWVQQHVDYLFLMPGKSSETIVIEIMQWPEPTGKNTPLQDLLLTNKFDDSELIEITDQKEVVFMKGVINLNQTMIIPSGYQVIIGPGTKINLTNKAALISYSTINIIGMSNDPVIFTSSDFTGNGLIVLQTESRSKIDHVIFENLNTLDYKGWTLTGAVTFYESDVDISHTRFYRNQCEDALNIIRSDFTVNQSSFEYIYGDAFDSDFSTGKVLNTVFRNIGNDAIDFSGSEILIQNTRIEKANDKGISGGEKSKLIVENTSIVESNIGVASKDLSIVEVYNSEILDCNFGLVLFRKKPEYGPSKMMLNKTSIINPKIKMLIEKGSVLSLDNELFEGTEKNLAEKFY